MTLLMARILFLWVLFYMFWRFLYVFRRFLSVPSTFCPHYQTKCRMGYFGYSFLLMGSGLGMTLDMIVCMSVFSCGCHKSHYYLYDISWTLICWIMTVHVPEFLHQIEDFWEQILRRKLLMVESKWGEYFKEVSFLSCSQIILLATIWS